MRSPPRYQREGEQNRGERCTTRIGSPGEGEQKRDRKSRDRWEGRCTPACQKREWSAACESRTTNHPQGDSKAYGARIPAISTDRKSTRLNSSHTVISY